MENIAPDKLAHFWVSFGIAFLFPVMAAAAGIGKEIYDSVSGGDADAGDLAADGLGILFALILSPFR